MVATLIEHVVPTYKCRVLGCTIGWDGSTSVAVRCRWNPGSYNHVLGLVICVGLSLRPLVELFRSKVGDRVCICGHCVFMAVCSHAVQLLTIFKLLLLEQKVSRHAIVDIWVVVLSVTGVVSWLSTGSHV